MSNGEKLYSGKCHLHGFGKCEISDEPRPDKRSMSKLRRKKEKKLIRQEFKELKHNTPEGVKAVSQWAYGMPSGKFKFTTG